MTITKAERNKLADRTSLAFIIGACACVVLSAAAPWFPLWVAVGCLGASGLAQYLPWE